MTIGGWIGEDWPTSSVEVAGIAKDNYNTCEIPNYPKDVNFPKALLSSKGIISCEHWHGCYRLDSNLTWVPFPNLKNVTNFSLHEINKTLIAIGSRYLTGQASREGFIQYINLQNGTEWTERKISLNIFKHCSVAISATEIMVIGGLKYDEMFQKYLITRTRILNIETLNWRNGPSLKQKRQNFDCTISKGTIYVVGGRDENETLLYSMETLKLEDDEWKISSKELPTPLAYHQVVASPSPDHIIYLIGGKTFDCYMFSCYNKVIYGLKRNGEEWEEVGQLGIGRKNHATVNANFSDSCL